VGGTETARKEQQEKCITRKNGRVETTGSCAAKKTRRSQGGGHLVKPGNSKQKHWDLCGLKRRGHMGDQLDGDGGDT